jgi:hypothetical protein
MQTLTVKNFNNKHPQAAFDSNTGYVTFDNETAVWASNKAQSIVDFEAAKLKLTRSKERAQKRIERNQAKSIEKKNTDYNIAIQSEDTTISIQPSDDRFDVAYKVGTEKRTRNLSAEMINSLLDITQRKAFTTGRHKSFKIDKYDFASIIVSGAKRPGIKN